MDETNPLGEVDAVEAIANLLDGPDDREPEIEEEEPTEEPQPEEVKEGEDSPEDESEPEPEELEEITWNDETKKVSKSELKELAQKGFDYTQKTQQLAEQRRSFEAQAKAMQESIALQNSQIESLTEIKTLDAQLAQYKDVRWHDLAESDPVAYLKANQTFRDLKDARDAKVQEFQQKAHYTQQLQQQLHAENVRKEMEKLNELPEFKGDKGKETRAKVVSYLKDAGFSPEEISNVTDARTVKLAWEAAQWHALQAAKPALTKRATEAPKVVKTGTVKATTNQASKDTYQALRKTGRGEYAAKLIEQML